MMTDPISDYLSRIRNAIRSRKETVDVPASKIKARLSDILQEEGFIRGYRPVKDERGHPALRLTLKYDANKVPSITGLDRISRPGYRTYVGADKIPQTMSGLGISILTTSKGVLSDRSAREKGVGGELICRVW